jgi:hypothetical protein
MHLLIPCAGVLSEAGLQALRGLHAARGSHLPELAALLSRLTPTWRSEGDEYSLSTPHERALAQALGWHGEDGALPWAAWWARQDGIDVGTAAWGLLSPTHQHVGTEQVSLVNPAQLDLDEAGSRALFEAVRDLFDSEGFQTAWGAPQRWYIAHPDLDGLATTSLDRVIGRNIDAWLPDQPEAKRLRRLQMEVQMVLHAHPLNEAREAAGQLAVNATWLSGCGRLPQTGADRELPTLDSRLRSAALAEDWAAWRNAWLALDSGPLGALHAAIDQGRPGSLTLCGERHAQRFEPLPQSWLAQLGSSWRSRGASPLPVLEAL